MNLKQILEMTVRKAPHKAALVLGSRKVTYQELDETSNRIANALIDAGFKRGGHIAILISHRPEWVSTYFGIIKAGGVPVLLSTALKAVELDSLLRDSDACVLITERKIARALDPFLADNAQLKQVLEIDSGSYKSRLAGASALPAGVDVDEGDTAAIIYTSGVLGRQKGVVHTHTSLLSTPDIVSAGIGRGGEDIIIDPVPFFYLLGLSEVLFGSIIKGATVVIISSFTPRAVLEAIERDRGTILFGVPAMHNALAMLREDVIKSYDLSSLRVASSAGAKTSAHLMAMLQDKFNLTFCETYGLSELSVVSMSTLADHRLGTVGRPVCELRIIGDDGEEVAVGEIGEAVFKAPWAMRGYYKAPELVAQVFKDDWFYTGDSVRMDEDGYLEYIEKESFIIVTPSGLKISPWEVEDILLQHPGVDEAVYVGVRDGQYGVVPTAFIVSGDKHKPTAKELTDLCRGQLADFKLPRRFEYVESIPKTGSGKINRHKLQGG